MPGASKQDKRTADAPTRPRQGKTTIDSTQFGGQDKTLRTEGWPEQGEVGDLEESPLPTESLWTADDHLRRSLVYGLLGVLMTVIVFSFILEMTGHDWRGWATSFIPIITYFMGVATPALFRNMRSKNEYTSAGRQE
jgi:hypothetical protein